METVALKVESRDTKVKSARIRKEGKIPAVIYGGAHLEHISTKINDVKHLIYTPAFKLAEVDVDGKKLKCIVKDVQYHPLTDNIEHIDFLAIEEGRKVKVEIPVKFKGESPGVKSGGKLMQTLRKVKVKLDPANIISELFIDISELQLGAAVRVKDIELDEDKIEVMVNKATPVATVEIPRAIKSAAAAEEGAEEGAEGEAATAEGAEAK
jgi:large subunit ribosomal protein L25